MNDRDRANLIQLCDRLSTWRFRSGKSIAEFVRANRDEIDKLLVPFTRSPQNRWRQWHELSPIELRKLQKKGRRQHRYGSARELLFQLRIIPTVTSIELANVLLLPRTRPRPYFNLSHRHPLRNIRAYQDRRLIQISDQSDTTPAERLYNLRKQMLRTLLAVPDNTLHATTFIENLHPDDVELSYTKDGVKAVVSRDCFNPYNASCVTIDPNAKILASQLYITDPEMCAEVYYCATVSKNIELERKYIARVRDISTGGWLITNKFSKAKDAYKSAGKLFSKSFARRLNPKED